MEARQPNLEVRDEIIEGGFGDTINMCMQCGLCTASCPWRMVHSKFSQRKLTRLAHLGLEGFEAEDILFACSTCGVCIFRCPRQTRIIDNIMAIRQMVIGAGTIPATYQPVLSSQHAHGNPWLGERGKRFDWAEGLDIPKFTADTEYLLFICCTSNYDTRSQKIARSVVEILKKAGVSFGIIGEEESCCGESIRKIGDEDLFGKLAQSNVNLFSEHGVKKIITTSPHCLYTFTKEYVEFGAAYEVEHYTQVIARLIKEGKLTLSKELEKKVTYHEPCYLGRHGQFFDPPREILTSIPKIDFREMDRIKMNSFCCGGGGGRVWTKAKPEESLAYVRFKEVLDKEADILATACPYCMIMLEDACKGLGKEDVLKVMDISELVSASL